MAVSRSSAASVSASFGVRTACPSFTPSSQIGYQTRSASGADVGAAGVQQHDVDVGLEAELGPAVAADRDQGDVAGAALGLGAGEELGEPAVDEVAVGPAQRPPDERAVALQRRPSRRPEPCPSLAGGRSRQIESTSGAGRHVDRIPGGRERRRVREVEVDQLVDAQPGVQRDRERVDPLGGPLLARRSDRRAADRCPARPRASRSSAWRRAGSRRWWWPRWWRRRPRSPSSAASRSVSPVRPTSSAHTLVIAVPTTPGKVA